MSLIRCSGVINTAALDEESYPFFPNAPATATKSFVCLVLYNIQSQMHNFQKAKVVNRISETEEQHR